jgi:hypothetical protein
MEPPSAFGKLTRGWVKIVVDIGTRALLTSIGERNFVCFAICTEPERAKPPLLVPTYYCVMEFLCFDVSKRIKQIFLRHIFVGR